MHLSTHCTKSNFNFEIVVILRNYLTLFTFCSNYVEEVVFKYLNYHEYFRHFKTHLEKGNHKKGETIRKRTGSMDSLTYLLICKLVTTIKTGQSHTHNKVFFFLPS